MGMDAQIQEYGNSGTHTAAAPDIYIFGFVSQPTVCDPLFS